MKNQVTPTALLNQIIRTNVRRPLDGSPAAERDYLRRCVRVDAAKTLLDWLRSDGITTTVRVAQVMALSYAQSHRRTLEENARMATFAEFADTFAQPNER